MIIILIRQSQELGDEQIDYVEFYKRNFFFFSIRQPLIEKRIRNDVIISEK